MSLQHQQLLAVHSSHVLQLQQQLRDAHDRNQEMLQRMDQRIQGLELVVTRQECALAAKNTVNPGESV